MPQRRRKEQQKIEFDVEKAHALRAQGLTVRAIAKALGEPYTTTYRKLKALPANGTSPTAIQRSEPLQPLDIPTMHIDAQVSALLLSRIEALEAHQRQVDAHLHTLTRALHTPAVQAMHTDVHHWADPEDAKPERWNLLLPRGLKRAIDEQARATGIPASTLVTRLLMAAMHTDVHMMHRGEE